MDKHRLSYLKTTLLALSVSLSLAGILLFAFATERITVLGNTWSRNDYLTLYWLILVLLAGGALLFFAIAVGGMICLCSDAKERTNSS
jgi:hypothetical protein